MSHEAPPSYPMDREAGCPFAPAATVRTMTRDNPVGKVRIWDAVRPGSSPGTRTSGRC